MRLRLFFIAFVLSLPFWWGINSLEKNLNDVFYWQEISQNPRIFTAQLDLAKKIEDSKPYQNKNAPVLDLAAKSAISILLKDNNQEKILFEKDANQKLAIASLTKLMTALIVLENYDLTKEIKITKEAISQEGNLGKLELNRVYSVQYLLYPLLMESSNDAAFALFNDYEDMNREKFVGLMNETAQKLNLKNTHFFNPTGLEPEEDKYAADLNYSTVADLVKLAEELLKKPLIWQILSMPTYNSYGPELKNTNELIFDESFSAQTKIIGAKTGYTEKAGGCILLVSRAPKNKGYLISVILGTANNNERFNQMKKLIEWLNSAYKW